MNWIAKETLYRNKIWEKFFPVFGGYIPAGTHLEKLIKIPSYSRPNPLVAKVSGVYKHSTIDVPDSSEEIQACNPQVALSYYSLSGQSLSSPTRGVNIVRQSDGSTKKVVLNP